MLVVVSRVNVVRSANTSTSVRGLLTTGWTAFVAFDCALSIDSSDSISLTDRRRNGFDCKLVTILTLLLPLPWLLLMLSDKMLLLSFPSNDCESFNEVRRIDWLLFVEVELLLLLLVLLLPLSFQFVESITLLLLLLLFMMIDIVTTGGGGGVDDDDEEVDRWWPEMLTFALYDCDRSRCRFGDRLTTPAIFTGAVTVVTKTLKEIWCNKKMFLFFQ